MTGRPAVLAVVMLLDWHGVASAVDRVEPRRERIVARAGATVIDERDLALRVTMLEARGVAGPDAPRALAELVAEALEHEVARRLDVVPTSQEVEAFDAHASRDSQAPQVLLAIRGAFGPDRGRYLRQVVDPRVTPHKLHARFAADREEHAEARQRIESALRRAQAGESLATVADAVGGERRAWTLPAAATVATSETRLASLVDRLADGALCDHIVEDDESLAVVRRLGRRRDGIDLEAVVIEKRPYEAWYRTQESGVELTLVDHELAAAVCARYGEASWLERACATPSRR